MRIKIIVPAAMLLIILLAGAIYVSRASSALQPASLPQGTVTISQSALEAQYGLRVNLVAVTAGGGLVDLRLTITDAEKARRLLQDTKNFPVLLVGGSAMALSAPEDTKHQEIIFKSDGDLLLMFPNAGDTVKPGTPVTLVFGGVALDPIAAR